MAKPKFGIQSGIEIPQTIFLYLVDASARERWEVVLSEAARANGLYIENGPAPQNFNPMVPTIVLHDDVSWTLHIPPERTLVFSDSDLPERPTVPTTFSDRHEIYKISRQQVIAAHVVGLGAVLHDRFTTAASVPGIGQVEGAPARPRPKSMSPLAMYASLPPRPGDGAEWSEHLFSYQQEAFFDGSPEIDLTGKPRMLLHGPYLFLPRGRWKADIRFAIDPEGGIVPIRIQWGKEGNFAELEARIELAGEYSLSMERDWDDPAPAQVVVSLTQALFRGQLVFRGCKVEMVSDLMAEETYPLLPTGAWPGS